MQYVQLGLVFIILVAIVWIVIKLLGFLIPIVLWLIGFIVIAGLVVAFTLIFFNKIKKR